MERRLLVAQPVEGRAQLRLERKERCLRLLFGSVPGLVREVELRAVAGREADDLAPLAGEGLRQLRCTVTVERCTLAQLDGRLMVGDADEDDAHVAKWVMGRARRTTATSTKPARTRYAARRPRQPAKCRSAS